MHNNEVTWVALDTRNSHHRETKYRGWALLMLDRKVNTLARKLMEWTTHASHAFSLPNHICCQLWEILFLELFAAVGSEIVNDQCVLDIAEHAHRGVHFSQFFNGNDGRKEGGAGTSIFGVDLYPH